VEHACAEGWICEQHPALPWPHDDCAALECPVRFVSPRRANEQRRHGCLKDGGPL
jgi:hypothetical protein